MEILELKVSITEMKNSLEGISSRLEQAEKIISKILNRLIEIVQSEKQREKKNEEK